MKVIDAENMIVGRVAAYAAKQALLGEEVKVVNSSKAVMTGSKSQILERYKQRSQRGRPTKGPFYPKQADRFVKRIIRGMLPYKQAKGRAAFDNIRCFSQVPEELKEQEIIKVKGAEVFKVPNIKYITIKEICRSLGGKE